ncbi:hypothetical protein JA1_004496 [Spathaspora sp. JA1]|nr:hypothetical protein JA1_004496 [Spathaspora sp. JA1]
MADLRTSSNPTSPHMRRKSSTITTTTHKIPSPRPEPTMIKRRNSSFANTSSPWFRRNSFLSQSMIQNENCSVYESPTYYSDSASFSIISLRECQGFLFNQDLFATPYQQSRSLANERKYRSSFSSGASTTMSKHAMSMKNCSSEESLQQRRRRVTSYHAPRPSVFSFGNTLDSSAIIDDSMEDDEDEGHEEETIPPYDDGDDDDDDDDGSEMTTAEDFEEYEEMNDYGGDSTNRRYRVRVTDILINEQERDIFPN